MNESENDSIRNRSDVATLASFYEFRFAPAYFLCDSPLWVLVRMQMTQCGVSENRLVLLELMTKLEGMSDDSEEVIVFLSSRNSY